MAAMSESDARPRRALLLRSQVPLAATMLIVLAVVATLGVDVSAHAAELAGGAGLIALSMVATVALPWERLPVAAQSVLAVVDIVAVCILAVALHGVIATAGMLAAFPAIWLAVVGGFAGSLVGMAGAFVAAILPLVVAQEPTSPAQWASALLPAVVVSVMVAVSLAMVRIIRRSDERTRRAMEQRNAAAAESERIGAVMRTFSDEIDLGLVYIDADGAAPLFNEPILAFGELARYDEVTGSGTLVFGDDQVTPMPAEQQPMVRLRRGEPVNDLLHWVGPRGHQRALLANGRTVHHSDGRVAGSMLIVQDITDPLRAERTREDALATLAHELRTPLTSIVGYADLLSTGALGPEASARVAIIQRNAEHLLRLTAAFLSGLHRPPSPVRERVRVRELIESCLDILVTTPGFAERELLVDVPAHLEMLADPDGMQTVLNSLLHNAVKFSRTGDRIRMTAQAEDQSIWLTVHNSGSRIDEEDLERIFDRFYRGGNAQREAVPGTGIGLSVSREIVHAHGGSLTAERVDDGACLRLVLPAAV